MSFKKILFLAFVFFQLTPLAALAADPTYPIIDSAACAKDAASGGWGGTCQFILVDLSSLGLGESNGCTSGREWAGYCGETGGDWSDLDYSCCIPNGSTTKGPLIGEAFYRDSACTLPTASGGAYGGSCKASCASGEKYAGACGESDTPCCVSGDTSTASETGTISSAGLTGPGAVNVGTNYTPLEYIPFLNGTTFQDYILGVYILGMVLVVLAAVFMLVIGGFQYLTSAGNTSALSSAKHTIEGALFGLALALVAYLILYVINPDLTKLNISTFQPLAPRAGGTTGGGGSAGGGGATGGTATSSLNAQDAAKKLLSSPRVSLGTDSGDTCPGGNASSKDNLQQVAAGKGMTRCPCGGGGNVAPSETLLNSLVDMAEAGAVFRINYIAGACHSSGSNHYAGTAVDIQRTPTLDAFFAKYPKVDNRPTYQVSGVKVWFEDSSHYHVSLTGR